MPSTSFLSIDELLEFAVHTVEEAGRVILPYFRSSTAVINKAVGNAFDPVTQADRAAEDVIRERIRVRFPHHGILGEERGGEGDACEYRWVIDPIDGTRAFILGQLHWGTLLGVTHHGKPLAGVMRQPYIGETYAGSASGTELLTTSKRHTLRARTQTRLADAVVCATDPTMFVSEEARAKIARVVAQARGIRYGGDCYTPCLVAAGHADLVIEAQLKPWDFLPLVPILEGAGAVITDWSGAAPGASGEVIIASNRDLHAEVLRAMHA